MIGLDPVLLNAFASMLRNQSLILLLCSRLINANTLTDEEKHIIEMTMHALKDNENIVNDLANMLKSQNSESDHKI